MGATTSGYIGSSEVSYNTLWVSGWPKRGGTQQLCRDAAGYYRKCVPCGREIEPAGKGNGAWQVPDRKKPG